MNDILKLLGTDYELRIRLIQDKEGEGLSNRYVVTVTNEKNQRHSWLFTDFEAQETEFDMLIFAINKCITALEKEA